MAPVPRKKVKISPKQSGDAKLNKSTGLATKQAKKPTTKIAPAAISAKGKERAPGPTPLLKAHKAKSAARSEAEPSSSSLPATFKVVAGSYEKLLYGLEGSTTAEGSRYTFQLKPIFIFPAHISSIRAVATSPQGGKWLATGSGDEIVKVWDLRRRKEIGGLMHHEGASLHPPFVRILSESVARLHNPLGVSLAVTPPFGVGRRHIMCLPRARLGCVTYTERAQGPGELCCRTSVRETRVECREG